MGRLYRLSSGDTFRINYEGINQQLFEGYQAWIDKTEPEPKVIGDADDMIDQLQKAVCDLRAELAGVRALRQWEEERLQDKERESWTTY